MRRVHEPDLEALCTAACRAIDAAAEAVRNHPKFLTPGSGQAMAYLKKEEIARRVIADAAAGEDVEARVYPMITSRVGKDGASNLEVAQGVVAQAEYWIPVGDLIEDLRLDGKTAVRSVASAASILRLRDDYVNQLRAIIDGAP